MAGFAVQVPPPWPSCRTSEILAELPDAFVRNSRKSSTLEEDKSQPPTPDGTGLPVNFASVGPGIYRCSYPQACHFANIQPLKINTIITFVPEDIPLDYQAFMRQNGIKQRQIHILANKDETVYTKDETVNEVIRLMLDKENFPILIHCNKGKHRTGCMTACFRKVTGWSLNACIEEYKKYSAPKSRELDVDFITRFDPSALKPLAFEKGFVGGAFAEPRTESSKDSLYTTYTYRSDDSMMSNDEGEMFDGRVDEL